MQPPWYVAEETEGDAAYQVQDEVTEDEMLECLLQEGDEDAALVCDFESQEWS